MDERQITELVRIGGQGIRLDYPMAQFTTFRAGGKAEALYFAPDLSELQRMIVYLNEEGIPYLVMGNGSNLLVKDGGFKGAVICLRSELATIQKNGKNDRAILTAGGVSIVKLLSYCRRHGLGGLEFLAGIPGTVGGAVAMSQRAAVRAVARNRRWSVAQLDVKRRVAPLNSVLCVCTYNTFSVYVHLNYYILTRSGAVSSTVSRVCPPESGRTS